jgi:glycosyltransferase involved in cell wall biosynthesis
MKFSIVTPSFQSSEWLKLCIASVADQHQDVEHIVQDSCSTDETAAWLPRDERVKAFVEKDQGMYDAINRGLAKTRGDVFAYLNCDEQYLPDTLRQVASLFAARPEIDILFGDVLVTDRAGNALTYRRVVRPSANHILLSHLNTFSCATFFRKRVLEQGHWLDPKWKSIGDAIWVHGILKAGLRVAIYPRLLSVFTLTGSNLSTDSPTSEQEKQRWLKEMGGSAPLVRQWHVGLHRVRKLIAGAYLKRTFDYHIYTLGSPLRRVRFTATNVGGAWKIK